MHQESDPKHLKPIYQQYQSQIYKCSPDTMYEESRSHSIKGEEVKTIKVNNPDRVPLLYCRDSKCKWTNQSGTKDLLGLNCFTSKFSKNQDCQQFQGHRKGNFLALDGGCLLINVCI